MCLDISAHSVGMVIDEGQGRSYMGKIMYATRFTACRASGDLFHISFLLAGQGACFIDAFEPGGVSKAKVGVRTRGLIYV